MNALPFASPRGWFPSPDRNSKVPPLSQHHEGRRKERESESERVREGEREGVKGNERE
jgi:hypothetical protein